MKILVAEEKPMTLRFVAAICVVAVFIFRLTSPHGVLAAPPGDACSLLTSAQVSEALGISVKNGERLVPTSPTMCGWAAPGGPLNAKHVVAAIITLESFNREKTPVQSIVKTQASGLGDDAHYITTPGFGTGLSVRKGGFAFKVRVYGFSDDELKQKERALAQEVLAKL